jgi:hypothetical protein
MASPNVLSKDTVVRIGTTKYGQALNYTANGVQINSSVSQTGSGIDEVAKIVNLMILAPGLTNTSDDYFLLNVIVTELANSNNIKGYIAKNLKVYKGTTLNLIDKTTPAYIQQGCILRAWATRSDSSSIGSLDVFATTYSEHYENEG